MARCQRCVWIQLSLIKLATCDSSSCRLQAPSRVTMGHLEGASAPFRAADSTGLRRQWRPPSSSSSHVHALMRRAASEKWEGGRRAPASRGKRRPKQNHQLQRCISGSRSSISVSRGWTWWTALPDFNAMNTVCMVVLDVVDDGAAGVEAMYGEYSPMSVYPEVSAPDARGLCDGAPAATDDLSHQIILVYPEVSAPDARGLCGGAPAATDDLSY
ncbi:unnamed protein product [Phytophthora fragariaefolia]|uniref:Unnamed protein product n=1 Tax=Phytophthora fragariaefolia TaxID=1490495 RepID=A0A9W6UBT2_9STRA|nr:unnamed protein product [Phytophthora fragariaefolia]